MQLQKIKRIFFNWLKSKGAYDAYKLARHNMNHYSESNHPYFRSTLNNPYDFINKSFTWRSTLQGYTFWQELNRKWIKYLLELKTDPRYN